MSAVLLATRHVVSSQSIAVYRKSLAALPRLASSSSGQEKPLPSEANVVVVGGGAIGVGLAYHLARLSSSANDVVLLEKSELTAGSTWHAAGLATGYHPGLNIRKLHYDSMQLYSQLEASGKHVGLHRPGSIRMAATPERMDEFRIQVSRAAWYSYPTKLITADEVVQRCPIVNPDGLLGGLYTPHDGHIDPYSITMAMASEARCLGAKLFLHTKVTGIEPATHRRWIVKTKRGTINCRHVVNAAGFWAQEVGRLLGSLPELPLIPIHHQYCVTDTVEKVKKLSFEIPVMRDLDGSYYLRQERNGLLVGPYEAVDRMELQESWVDGVPANFGKELFESNLDRISPNMEMAVDRFPALGDAPIIRTVAGPITYTPDIIPLLGPVPSAPGLWLAAGFGYGIIHAGGAGRFLAHWIRHGEPPYELMEADPSRFSGWADRVFIAAKARESYGMNTSMLWSKEERWAGRPTKRNNFDMTKLLRSEGAEFGFKAGWEVPNWFARPGDEPGYSPSFQRTNWFEPVGRESQAVRERVGVIDLTSFGVISVAGKDSRTYLDHLFANSLPKVGKGRIAHMLTPSGKVMSEMTIACTSDNDFFLVTGGTSDLHDIRWMEEHKEPGRDVLITNLTDQWSCIGVAGPRSPQLLASIFGEEFFLRRKWPLLSHDEFVLANGCTVRAMRISYTGELGWELHLPGEHAADLYRLLMENGREFGVHPFGSYALNSLRIEKGFRAWGAEISNDNSLHEAGMEGFIRLQKGDFIGREAVLEEIRRGINEQLVMLEIDTAKSDPEGAEAVYCLDSVVGHTSSGCYGYQVQKSLAFAYVKPMFAYPSLELSVDIVGSKQRAIVSELPPVKPYHLR